MSTIRERDATDWAVLVPEDEADEDMLAMFDVHALLDAGDALAGIVAERMGIPEGFHRQPCPCWAHKALAAWKAATG